MLDVSYLNRLRRIEMERILPYLTPGARILEFGAGTGQQAKFLAERGFEVVAIDLPNSNYVSKRVFPIIEYDGQVLPLKNSSIDFIFSSNVLEHVDNLEAIFAEFNRVSKPGALSLHVLPTSGWRFWTFVTGGLQSTAAALALPFRLALMQRGQSRWGMLRAGARRIAAGFIPRAHGTDAFAISELWSFSRFAWRRKFQQLGFSVVEDWTLGLFYTGNLLVGGRLPDRSRQTLSRFLGSAVRVYLVRPRRRST